MLPLTPDAPGAAAGRRVAAALRDDDRPALMLWADSDAALPIAFGEAVASALRYPRPRVITKAGHFVPEDAGPEIGRLIAEWLTKRP
jgi:haloalkane dehalogenase